MLVALAGVTSHDAAEHRVRYLRVSGKGHADGDGPERQRQSIAKFAKSAGFAVLAEFSDLGVSGAPDLAWRPGIAALLDLNGVRHRDRGASRSIRARSHGQEVIVASSSRSARACSQRRCSSMLAGRTPGGRGERE